MSTKIYDAYRIKKDNAPEKFIGDILKQFKNKVENFVINDKGFLEALHKLTAVWLELEEEDGERLERYLDSEYPYSTIYSYARECEKQLTHDPIYIDIKLSCSVFEDDEYWYLKFFCNNRWQWDLLHEWEEESEWLEDYHYQNQSDPPEDIPYEEFKKRDDKWDELLGDVDNYTNGLQYTFLNASQLYSLLTSSSWKDDVELAYDFTQGLDYKNNDEEE